MLKKILKFLMNNKLAILSSICLAFVLLGLFFIAFEDDNSKTEATITSTNQVETIKENSNNDIDNGNIIKKDNDIVSMSIETEEIEEIENISEGYLFVGDSRFVGMNNVCNIKKIDNYFVVAEVGKGYDWFVSEAQAQIDSIISNNVDIEKWNMIIGLGVNDLNNKEKYVSLYKELSEKYTLYIMSVNPIEYHSWITNSQIEEFNLSINSIENTNYIDSYNYLIENGFSTSDGLHYDNNTYEKIFSFINDYLNKDTK